MADYESREPFSVRHGHAGAHTPIRLRETADPELRRVVYEEAMRVLNSNSYAQSLGRWVVSGVWDLSLQFREVVLTAANVWPGTSEHGPAALGDARQVLENCEWFRVYDVIEAIHRWLPQVLHKPPESPALLAGDAFRGQINRYLHMRGYGWELTEDGVVTARETHAVEEILEDAEHQLGTGNRTAAYSALRDARKALSARPVQAGIAAEQGIKALERYAVIVDLRGRKTLPEILNDAELFPAPLNQMAAKLYAFVKDRETHQKRTSGQISREQAVLIVGLCASLLVYLLATSEQPSE